MHHHAVALTGASVTNGTLNFKTFPSSFENLLGDRTDDSVITNPWLWVLVHGLGVLAAAAFQVVAWRLTEAEERQAQDNLAASQRSGACRKAAVYRRQQPSRSGRRTRL